ncbi:MAG: MFS transporter [Terracidiphilus sp.]|jgi:hypothetical protein
MASGDGAGCSRLPPFTGVSGLVVIYTVLGALYRLHLQGKPMLVLVLAAIACYAMSLAPATWVVIAEIFPNRIRSSAMSIAITALWTACFLLTYTFPLLNAALRAAGKSRRRWTERRWLRSRTPHTRTA